LCSAFVLCTCVQMSGADGALVGAGFPPRSFNSSAIERITIMSRKHIRSEDTCSGAKLRTGDVRDFLEHMNIPKTATQVGSGDEHLKAHRMCHRKQKKNCNGYS
jgi:hypothetical protein